MHRARGVDEPSDIVRGGSWSVVKVSLVKGGTASTAVRSSVRVERRRGKRALPNGARNNLRETPQNLSASCRRASGSRPRTRATVSSSIARDTVTTPLTAQGRFPAGTLNDREARKAAENRCVPASSSAGLRPRLSLVSVRVRGGGKHVRATSGKWPAWRGRRWSSRG